MDKTPIGRRFLLQLMKINDQLCYSAFLHHEFDGIMSHYVAATPDDFTPTVFPLNPHSKRMYRRLKDLSAFSSQSSEISFQMGIVAAFESTAAYLEEIEQFRALIKPSPQDSIRKDAVEDQFFCKLQGWLPKPPKKIYFRSLGYCRHMRNSFAHAHDGASKDLSSYTNSQ